MQAPAPAEPAPRSWFARLGHDLLFLAPGFLITCVLGTVLWSAAGTALGFVFIIIGLAIIPVIPLLGAFAGDLTRWRYNFWGRASGRQLPYVSRVRLQSLEDYVRLALNGRYWLDFVYESTVAFVVRGIIAAILLAYAVAALLGPVGVVAVMGFPHAMRGSLSFTIAESIFRYYSDYSWSTWLTIDAVLYGSMAVFALVTFPFAVRLLARIEAAITSDCLGGDAFGSISARGWGNTAVFMAALATIPFAGVATFGMDKRELVALVTWTPLLAAPLAALTPRLPRLATASLAALVAAVAIAGVAFGGYEFYELPALWPVSVPLALLALNLASLAATRHLRLTFGHGFYLVVVGFVVAVVQVLLGARYAGEGYVELAAVGLMTLLSIAAAIGIGMGARILTDRMRELGVAKAREVEITRELEHSETVSAELAERTRIAREMHDVVAHSMSVISVQARTAPYRLASEDMSDEARAEFASIAQTSRAALGEMRSLLTVLRGTQDRDAQMAPQPGLADVPALVEATRTSGVRVDLAMRPADAAEAPIPGTVALTLYRAVQEGLANALRHAPGAPVHVDIDVASPVAIARVQNGAPTGDSPAGQGSGFGLRGITERVGALGGTTSAGATPDDGFALEVRIPLA